MFLIKYFSIISVWVFAIENADGNEFADNGRLTMFNFRDFINFTDVYTLGIRENGRESNFSEMCKQQLQVYEKHLKYGSNWAWRMFDASSKLQSGVLELNWGDLGNFDECINIEIYEKAIGKIYGQHCFLQFQFLNNLDNPMKKPLIVENIEILTHKQVKFLQYRNQLNYEPAWSICLPGGCTSTEILEYFQNLINNESLKLNCQSLKTQPELRMSDYLTIGGFSLILFCVFLSTVYEIQVREKPNEVFTIFSLVQNYRTLFYEPKSVKCLDGIRTLSILWIIILHRNHHLTRFYNTNKLYTISNTTSKLLYNLIGEGNLAVETFLLISGFLVIYTYKSDKKLNFFDYVLRRYFRLTPVLVVLTLFCMTLIRFCGSGPIWSLEIEPNVDSCWNFWWARLLYINNYINNYYMCVGHAWYLDVNTQLHTVTFILLGYFVLVKNRKIWIFPMLSLLIITSIAGTIFFTWKLFSLETPLDIGYTFKYYVATHARTSSWVVGLLLGYIASKTKQSGIKLSNIFRYVAWALTITICLYFVFGLHETHQRIWSINPEFYAPYYALRGFGWSIGISWIIFACVHGYADNLNSFLSLKIFQFGSKISYCMYLVHYLFQLIEILNRKEPVEFNYFQVVYQFFADTTITVIISIILYLTIEIPFMKLYNLLSNLSYQIFHSTKL